MKSKMLVLFAASAMAMLAWAEDGHDHGALAGPKGGKMLEATPHHAEFWVNPERRVEVTFYDEHGGAMASAEQIVRVTAQAPGGNQALTMEKRESGFASAEALPEGDGYTVVVQVRADPSGAFQNFRVSYETEICGECNRAEYACACDH